VERLAAALPSTFKVFVGPVELGSDCSEDPGDPGVFGVLGPELIITVMVLACESTETTSALILPPGGVCAATTVALNIRMPRGTINLFMSPPA
jgi:hypothetical protein